MKNNKRINKKERKNNNNNNVALVHVLTGLKIFRKHIVYLSDGTLICLALPCLGLFLLARKRSSHYFADENIIVDHAVGVLLGVRRFEYVL